jgi:hypothetical protein
MCGLYKNPRPMFKRSRLKTSPSGFEAKNWFDLLKFTGQKSHEEDLMMMYLTRQGMATNDCISI